ncbi:MAG: tetratricopeptide repeat protein, partial [Synergistes sp.]|nr:tetratricopeptide repeat protein [Synergistes sp.]
MSNDNKGREPIECPDIVPEEQKGMTDEEREWIAKAPPKPRVPRYVFVAAALVLAAAFGGGGFWYYRTNVLPEKYNQRAEALMKEKNYAQAEELYKKIIKIRPERKDVLFNMAICCEENGDAESAIKYCEEHLKTAKNDSRAMTRLAWLYMKSESYEKALHWFREAVKHNKKNEELWHMTAEAAKKAGDVKTAAEALLQRAKLCAGDIEKMLFCGKELLTLGNYKDAAEIFAAAAASSAPDDSRALHGVKAARAMLGLPTEEKYIIRPGRSLGLIRIGA